MHMSKDCVVPAPVALDTRTSHSAEADSAASKTPTTTTFTAVTDTDFDNIDCSVEFKDLNLTNCTKATIPPPSLAADIRRCIVSQLSPANFSRCQRKFTKTNLNNDQKSLVTFVDSCDLYSSSEKEIPFAIYTPDREDCEQFERKELQAPTTILQSPLPTILKQLNGTTPTPDETMEQENNNKHPDTKNRCSRNHLKFLRRINTPGEG